MAVVPQLIVDPQATERAESHVVTIADGDWPLWRWAGLRGAGFSVEQVFKLASPECAAAADELLHLEQAVERNRERAVKEVNSALDALRSGAGWENREQRDPLVKAIRLLKMGKVAKPAGVDTNVDAALEELRELTAKVPTAAEAFEQAYKTALEQTSLQISEVANDSLFQQAVIWQSRHAFHTAIGPLLRRAKEGGSRDSKQKQLEELIASYLQRYCVKNDTIGFFGPVGWARLMPEGPGLTARPGPNLIAERSVHLEVWCMDVLAETLARNESLRIWCAPRRMSYIHLVGNVLHLPSKPPVKLPAEQAAVLHACDGQRSAKELARVLLKNPYLKLKSESEVYTLLDQLCSNGLMVWKFEVPIESFPERSLRRTLERIEDESLRDSTLAALNEIEGARSRVEVAGDPGELNEAIGELEESFTRLTGSASTRSAGEMYAGRTLVYEDCRRDVEVEIGPELINALGPPLSLLLLSSRWFCRQVAAATRDIFWRIYRDITRRTNSPIVDLPTFWYRFYPEVFGEDIKTQPIVALMPGFQKRWASVLSLPPGARRVALTAEELRPRVQEQFNASDSGWKSAIYHSPDLMIAAESVDAIRRGDYQLVLGEMHASVNTLRPAFFNEHHPSPGDLNRYFQLDQILRRAVPLIPKSLWPAKTARLLPVLITPQDFRIEFVPEPNSIPPSQVLPSGMLVVEDCGGELVVRTRDGRLQFDPLEVFSDTPTLSAINSFNVLASDRHTPRVTIDRLVVSRESWTFTPDEISSAYEKTDSARFIEARRWAQAHGIPRFAFAKASSEVKPVFVDFDSPIYVNIFSKIVRRARGTKEAKIVVSEMLPSPDQVWLPDAAGRHYTSEFRVVAVDSPQKK